MTVASNITAMLSAIATMATLAIKREKVLLSPVRILRAMNKGAFKSGNYLALLKYTAPAYLVRGLLLLFLLPACQREATSGENTQQVIEVSAKAEKKEIVVGAARFDTYLPVLKGKSVGMIVNHSSLVGSTHLVDTLLSLGVNVKKIFAPEHGFRGTADAGETVKNNVDTRTGLPVISLYGSTKKPGPAELSGLDVVVFDIQDVGARFYTYISTMSLAMEACAEQGLDFMVLDRPNPNGHYVDGPVLETSFTSFVGMHPVPIVHGMTVGEYAQMVNGEKWLKGGVQCRLQIVTCENYTHSTVYEPPVKPSPNLPDIKSIYLYPSLCFFEGTPLSVGRGTDRPFQLFGAPEYVGKYAFSFTPESKPGAKNPPLLGKRCYGIDLGNKSVDELRNVGFNLEWIIEMYQNFPRKESFFTNFFNTLAGTFTLQQQIRNNVPIKDIRASWEPALTNYKSMRMRYLLYEE
jgi:uncharacterized protein YbbC (DUF1343 family)